MCQSEDDEQSSSSSDDEDRRRSRKPAKKADSISSSSDDDDESDDEVAGPPPGYLFCCRCAKDVHQDSFSAAQKRGANCGMEAYCLLHTSGDHRFYIEQLELTAQRNLENEDDDEAREETAKEVKLFSLSGLLLRRYRAFFEKFHDEDKALARRRAGWAIFFGMLSILTVYACYAWVVSDLQACVDGPCRCFFVCPLAFRL